MDDATSDVFAQTMCRDIWILWTQQLVATTAYSLPFSGAIFNQIKTLLFHSHSAHISETTIANELSINVSSVATIHKEIVTDFRFSRFRNSQTTYMCRASIVSLYSERLQSTSVSTKGIGAREWQHKAHTISTSTTKSAEEKNNCKVIENKVRKWLHQNGIFNPLPPWCRHPQRWSHAK